MWVRQTKKRSCKGNPKVWHQVHSDGQHLACSPKTRVTRDDEYSESKPAQGLTCYKCASRNPNMRDWPVTMMKPFGKMFE